MAIVKIEPMHEEKTPASELKRPIYDMFKKVENYDSPLLKNELLRKRQKVRRVS